MLTRMDLRRPWPTLGLAVLLVLDLVLVVWAVWPTSPTSPAAAAADRRGDVHGIPDAVATPALGRCHGEPSPDAVASPAR